MNTSWFEANWFWALVGFIVCIPAAVFGNWLYEKLKHPKKQKSKYFSANLSNDVIEFEGRFPYDTSMTASIQDIAQKVLGSTVLISKKSEKKKNVRTTECPNCGQKSPIDKNYSCPFCRFPVLDGRHARGVYVRTRLRLWVELFSLMTVFLILGFALFSTTNDTLDLFKAGRINISILIHNSHIVYQAAGWFPVAIALVCFILMFIPSKAEQFATWIIESGSNLHGYFWVVFWPVMSGALALTSFIGFVDISSKLPTVTERSIAVVTTMIILLVSLGATNIGLRKR